MVVGSGGIDGVDDIVANGPQGILKHYFRLEWLNCPMLGGFSGSGGGGGGGVGGGGGGSDDDGGGCGSNGYCGVNVRAQTLVNHSLFAHF